MIDFSFLIISLIRVLASAGGLIDLELGEIREYLAHSCPCQGEIFDDVLAEKQGKLSETFREAQTYSAIVTARINPHNLKARFKDFLIFWLCSVLGWWSPSSTNLCFTFRMDKLGLRDQQLHLLYDVIIIVVEHFFGLLNWYGVSVPILVLEVIGRAEDDESTIDHDCYFVAELLSFIHAMCS